MIRDAEQFEEADKIQKEKIELHNKAEQLIYEANKSINDPDIAKFATPEKLQELKDAVSDLQSLISTGSAVENSELEAKSQHLRDLLMTAFSEGYRNAAAQNQSSEGSEESEQK